MSYNCRTILNFGFTPELFLDYESEGQGFESLRARQGNNKQNPHERWIFPDDHAGFALSAYWFFIIQNRNNQV